MTTTQIAVRVKNAKTGVVIAVNIEPHATVSMLKQRVSYIVKTHEKHQILRTAEHGELDNISKLEDLGIVDGSEVELSVPEAAKEELVVLSDDESLVAPEADEPPALPEKLEPVELDEAAMDSQCSLKQKAADAEEDGDLAKAVEHQTAAILLSPSALMLAKRAELLLKLKKPKSAVSDATAALKMNPDSCKALRIRGKALRQLGDYEAARQDLAAAQRSDFDDGVESILRYVATRCETLRKVARQGPAE